MDPNSFIHVNLPNKCPCCLNQAERVHEITLLCETCHARFQKCFDHLHEVSASQNIHCPACKEKQFSALDKLFTEGFGLCVDCVKISQLEELSSIIFPVIAMV